MATGDRPAGPPERPSQNRYFGPYAHAYAIRETLDLLLRTFPVRSCSDGKFARHQRLGRPCLMYHIERCAGPCAGLVDHEQYSRLVEDLGSFLAGDTSPVVDKLGAQMREAAAEPRVRTGGEGAGPDRICSQGHRKTADGH